jgi:predicted Zn finger-like uncharacterized protein
MSEAASRGRAAVWGKTPRHPAIRYEQPCPACGRRLRIDAEHLGRRVACGHCGRVFVARDGSMGAHGIAGVELTNLERAERLLAE